MELVLYITAYNRLTGRGEGERGYIYREKGEVRRKGEDEKWGRKEGRREGIREGGRRTGNEMGRAGRREGRRDLLSIM